jgi:hypothetical protein
MKMDSVHQNDQYIIFIKQLWKTGRVNPGPYRPEKGVTDRLHSVKNHFYRSSKEERNEKGTEKTGGRFCKTIESGSL